MSRAYRVLCRSCERNATQRNATDNGSSAFGVRGPSEVTDFHRRMQQPGACPPSPVDLQIVTGGMSPDLRMTEKQERVCVGRDDPRQTFVEPSLRLPWVSCANARKWLQKDVFPCSLETDAVISNRPKYASVCSVCLTIHYQLRSAPRSKVGFSAGPTRVKKQVQRPLVRRIGDKSLMFHEVSDYRRY